MEINQTTTEAPLNPMPLTPAGDDVRDNKLMAALSYIWILSVVFLFLKKDSPFVQYHAKQGLVMFAASIVFRYIPIIGIFLNIALFVMAIVGIIGAWQGKWTKLPVISNLAAQIKF